MNIDSLYHIPGNAGYQAWPPDLPFSTPIYLQNKIAQGIDISDIILNAMGGELNGKP